MSNNFTLLNVYKWYKKNIKILVVLLYILTSTILVSKDIIHHLFLTELGLSNRIGSKYFYRDNFKIHDPIKKQTIIFFGEYQFLKNSSIYLAIPFTSQWIDGIGTRKFIDHIRIVNKWMFSWNKKWLFYTGLLIDVPRFHKKGGDVAPDVGYIEPYLGFQYEHPNIFFRFSIHWNTQTNPEFIEEKDQQFTRKWLWNFSLGGKIKQLPHWDFWIESQYQNIYDPEQIKKNDFTIGPAIRYQFQNILISGIYMFHSNQSDYQRTFGLQIEKIF